VSSCCLNHFLKVGYGIGVFETFRNEGVHFARRMKKIVLQVDNYDSCVGWDGHDDC
jgi:hypothetical protein